MDNIILYIKLYLEKKNNTPGDIRAKKVVLKQISNLSKYELRILVDKLLIAEPSLFVQIMTFWTDLSKTIPTDYTTENFSVFSNISILVSTFILNRNLAITKEIDIYNVETLFTEISLPSHIRPNISNNYINTLDDFLALPKKNKDLQLLEINFPSPDVNDKFYRKISQETKQITDFQQNNFI